MLSKKIGNELTGKHIALQIKSGESYLKDNKKGRIGSWHYKYWLQSDRPVIILFYDVVEKMVIWEQVNLSHINRTKSDNFKITINPSNCLSCESEDLLNDIIASYQSHHFYELDEDKVTFEHSLYLKQEMLEEFDGIVQDLNSFHNKIQGINTNNYHRT